MSTTKLVAEVLKRWRANSEERALGDYILKLTKLNLADCQKLTVPDLTKLLQAKINEAVEEEPIQEPDGLLFQEEEPELTNSVLQQTETKEVSLPKELPPRIIELRKRGRVKK
jgi:hypothetical protein